MPDLLSEFHFLRPIWLVGLLALPILIWLLHRLVARASAWRDVLDNDLAEPLLVSRGQRSRLRPLPLLTAVWLLTVIALAGPTWEKRHSPSWCAKTPWSSFSISLGACTPPTLRLIDSL